MTPVPELYEITEAPEREVEDILLLNLVQSVVERQPKTEAEAVSQVTVLTERVSPVLKVKGTS